MFDIALIYGDGYSTLLSSSAKAMLSAVAKSHGFSLLFHEIDVGAFLGKRESEIASCDEFKAIKSSDATIYTAGFNELSGFDNNNDVVSLLCKNLCLYGNFKEIKSFSCSISNSVIKNIDEAKTVDFLIVHDSALKNNFKKGYENGSAGREAYDLISLPEMYAERIARVAYELAEGRKKKLVSADFSDLFNTEFLRRKITHEINEDYPFVNLSSMTFGEVTHGLLVAPSAFDVIVANEVSAGALFEMGASIVGGYGNSCEGYLGDSATGLYKPARVAPFSVKNPHGVNPVGTLLAVSKLLKYSLDKRDASQAVEDAVTAVIDLGYVTPDMKNRNDNINKVFSAEEFTNEVISRL